MNPLALTFDQFAAEFRERYGRGHFHAAALYKAFYRQAPLDLGAVAEFGPSPKLRRQVQNDLCYRLPEVLRKMSSNGTVKLVFGLDDGCEIETVVVPMVNYVTVCISSQVGCRMGCQFCETGRLGWRRNLSSAEIVAQIHAVKVRMGLAVRNVVFMGMGEPLDNLENVIQAVRVLEDQRGLNIARRRITISTAGLTDGLRRLAALNWPQLKLAVSLNASNDALRSELMPVNRRFPMPELKNVLWHIPLARGNVLLIEYVLIRGVNDAPVHARELAAYLEGLQVKLNLIAYNRRSCSPFEAPAKEDLERFRRTLVAQEIFVRQRTSKGESIRAACGQLGRVFEKS
jgi:23S rRNA (adenine2503-C2)-methyltransferase